MGKFKIGDIVARISYGCDVLFKIVGFSNSQADLVGLTVRIIANAPENDLKHISKDEVRRYEEKMEKTRRVRMDRCYNSINRKFKNMGYNNYGYKKNNYNCNHNYYSNFNNKIRDEIENDIPNIYKKDTVLKRPGVVLHLDGDKDFYTKCKENYARMGITAYTYYIPENEQYRQVYPLLQKIRPNILILTGHDAFIKKRNDIYNIENYKNSKYYIKAVLEARRYEHNLDNLVIFAGACQSYYEALIAAGANFASAPRRVLIDMMDPLIVAQAVAYTSVNEFVSLENIISNTREGINGVGGTETRGQLRKILPSL